MITPDLQAHLSDLPELEAFDSWIWGFERFGRDVIASAAAAVAEAALGVWGSYEGPDARDWHHGNEVFAVARGVRACVDPEVAGIPSDLAVAADQLARRVEQMGHYVDEASGSRELCALRERSLCAARSVFAAARVALWTPDDVALIEDRAEYQARIESGPMLQFAECCRLAVFSLGDAASASGLALSIKRTLLGRFADRAG